MRIDNNKAIEWVAKIHGMDLSNANLPWRIVSTRSITDEWYSCIKDCRGKPIMYFDEDNDSDFSGEDLCSLVNMFLEIRKECGEDKE